jgi:hypothetical protein
LVYCLTQLSFGGKFNQPLMAGVLPTTLKQLSFGNIFNQPRGVFNVFPFIAIADDIPNGSLFQKNIQQIKKLQLLGI